VKIHKTSIPDLNVVQSSITNDERGGFSRLYCQREISEIIGSRRIVQINHSSTNEAGTLRGLHFQYAPHAEMKLVRCLKGRVWDVAVDLRQGSPSFLRWHAEELSPLNARMMVIPEGFAHGFQVLDPSSELLYLHTEFYHTSSEGGLRYDDPLLAIRWPVAVTNLSHRDASHSFVETHFSGILP
jgi:dTDP-4-dehydrorhamnose 3,5-epimerase